MGFCKEAKVTTFRIDEQDYEIESLGDDAVFYAQRMQELQTEFDTLQVRVQEIQILQNAYATTIKNIANPDPKIEVVK
jgi:hypothetical protein